MACMPPLEWVQGGGLIRPDLVVRGRIVSESAQDRSSAPGGPGLAARIEVLEKFKGPAVEPVIAVVFDTCLGADYCEPVEIRQGDERIYVVNDGHVALCGAIELDRDGKLLEAFRAKAATTPCCFNRHAAPPKPPAFDTQAR